jgi:hypothetical protein
MCYIHKATQEMNILILIVLWLMQYPSTSTSNPIAMHKLVVMTPDKPGIVIRLQGVEKSGKRLIYVISQLPAHGTLYQLSNVYSSHGYEPIQGTQITSNNTTIRDSMNRVYYKPANRRLCSERADSFAYTVTAQATYQTSHEGIVTTVNSHGTIVCSDFLLGPDGWTIIGNKQRVSNPIYEPYSRNNFINHYIYATDNNIHVATINPMHTQTQINRDKALWYFNAPSKMLGNMGIAYGGYISFVISIFAGDTKKMNKEVNLVELECSRCGYKTGITLGYRMPNNPMINNKESFNVELRETENWYKYPQYTSTIHTSPSKCEFIQVLSQLSGLRILGDLTTWTETVALDNVYIIGNTNNMAASTSIPSPSIIPLCAMSKPNATICSCV